MVTALKENDITFEEEGVAWVGGWTGVENGVDWWNGENIGAVVAWVVDGEEGGKDTVGGAGTRPDWDGSVVSK